jgi:hypothetical protein
MAFMDCSSGVRGACVGQEGDLVMKVAEFAEKFRNFRLMLCVEFRWTSVWNGSNCHTGTD